MKIFSQEEINTNNELVEVKKEEYLEDPCNQTGQGKSSPVLIAANQVTLKETVDSRSKETHITNQDKAHHAPGKGMLKKMEFMLLEVSLTIAVSSKRILHSKRHKIG
jgi:hypothetical protein